tara:strand:- start:184 stop:384 length:201 start_codon:yes stop_codon:yes gene_type:complete
MSRKISLSLFFISLFSRADNFESNLLLYRNFDVDLTEIDNTIVLNNRDIDGENQSPDEEIHIYSLF